MFQSIRHSQFALRIGLALVFLWFGIDKFIMPEYWLNAWVPQGVQTLLGHMHLAGTDFIFLMGIFEVLTAVSLASGFFMRFFATAAALMLVVILCMNGLNEVTVRDAGLIGGLIALVIWPERTYV